MATGFVTFSAEITVRTVERLIHVVAELDARPDIDEVRLLLSTSGGEVAAGIYAYNLLCGFSTPLITHNVGSVASIGNVVFLAGSRRLACQHSSFMIHGVSLHEQTLISESRASEIVASLRQNNQQITSVIAARTKISSDEAAALMNAEGVFDPDWALGKGMINGIEEVSIPSGSPVVPISF